MLYRPELTQDASRGTNAIMAVTLKLVIVTLTASKHKKFGEVVRFFAAVHCASSLPVGECKHSLARTVKPYDEYRRASDLVIEQLRLGGLFLSFYASLATTIVRRLRAVRQK
jgi:hypothetical protein